MKKMKVNIKTTIIILLIGIIIALISIILNMKNNNIIKPETNKEQLGETTNSNGYVEMQTHLSELNAKQQEINNIQNIAGQATATEGQILKNYTAYSNGKLITGTMTNNGAVTKALNAGESYTIPIGYHNGSGKVTANSLASQTTATATESDIAQGKTAWVDGKLITGIGTALNDENTESGYKTLGPSGNTTVNLKSTPKIILVKPAATDIEANTSSLYEAYINGKYYGYSGTTTCLMIKNVTDSSFLLCNYMGDAYSFAYRIWY